MSVVERGGAVTPRSRSAAVIGAIVAALGFGAACCGPASAQPATGAAPAGVSPRADAASSPASTGAASGPLPHCVGDRPLEPAGPRAWLDDADRDAVLAALQARFPQIARDGLDARAVLLWRHAGDDWRYAALIDDGRRPGQRCIAASFAASSIPATVVLLRKYFFAGGERS